MGGSRANGAGFKPCVDPTAVGEASSRLEILIVYVLIYVHGMGEVGTLRRRHRTVSHVE